MGKDRLLQMRMLGVEKKSDVGGRMDGEIDRDRDNKDREMERSFDCCRLQWEVFSRSMVSFSLIIKKCF